MGKKNSDIKETNSSNIEETNSSKETAQKPKKKSPAVVNISYGKHDPDNTYHIRAITRVCGAVFCAIGLIMSMVLRSLDFLGFSFFGLIIYLSLYPRTEIKCIYCSKTFIIRRRAGESVVVKCPYCNRNVNIHFRKKRISSERAWLKIVDRFFDN